MSRLALKDAGITLGAPLFTQLDLTLSRDTALIVASHDRAFLDDIATRRLFLRDRRSPVFALPCSKAQVALDAADAATGHQHDLDLRAARQLRRQAAKLKNIGINSGSDLLITKTNQLTK